MPIWHWLRTVTVLALVSTGVAGTCGEARSQIQIMPLGDSITDGYNVPGGYRINLWGDFQAVGLDAVFVGSLSNGPPELGSQNHEGHNGWRIDQIASQIDGWLDTYQPDLILLHIGTNDILQDHSRDTMVDRLSALIDQITDDLPGSILTVAMITPLDDPVRNEWVVEYNQLIPDLVAQKAAEGRFVILVDMYDAGVTLADGVHPTRDGYDAMAEVWFEAILSLYGGE
jgi:lysophospholipase L1-like esterase